MRLHPAADAPAPSPRVLQVLRSAALAVMLLGVCAPGTAAADTRAACTAPGRLLAADRSTTLTYGTRGDLSGTWGCVTGHRAKYLGEFLAASPRARDGQVAFIRRDLREPAQLCVQSLRQGGPHCFTAEGVFPQRLFISTRVTVFWVGQRTAGSPDSPASLTETEEVHRLVGGRQDTLLDSGVHIPFGSLAVTASGAYWLNDGVARFAGLQ